MKKLCVADWYTYTVCTFIMHEYELIDLMQHEQLSDSSQEHTGVEAAPTMDAGV